MKDFLTPKPYDIDFFTKKAEIKLHIRKFLLYPKFWEDSSNHFMNKLNWKRKKFLHSNKSKIPIQKGIYCFVLKPTVPNFFETRYLLYHGQTSRTLRKRFEEYLDDQKGKGKPRPKVFEMLNLYKNYLYFYFAEITSSTLIDEAEEKFLNTFIPQINTSIPKAKINPELMYIYE